MILFTLTDPSKYELLINAIMETISLNPLMSEKYEQLIEELNQSLTRRITISSGSNKVDRQCGKSTQLLQQETPWSKSSGGHSATDSRHLQSVPLKLDSEGRRNFYYKSPGSNS